ncbi:YHS domain-containing protein [Cellulomonas carbonis]|uniref:TRASH domain-containing protein n=1 Tax=Cellulomonas carbonis T26 TaxID=947969 RepID=A0A0A0BTA7_9CELL|nr:YHS domain-containing protein [Cellulomonas carbonis]KGM10922.1 hypothetical protein N868_13125 [Cellulomonas carbonis T26]GGC12961.1 hypothetical protein GCM10010972_27890 [Cellulomonas carbonis]
MAANDTTPQRAADAARLTACSLCAGETLAGADPLPGGQRARLDRLASRSTIRMTYVECLDECERGDVVVARPSRAQRARGVGPVWFETLAGDTLTCELEQWLTAGGPGVTPVPERLAQIVIDRTGEPTVATEGPHSAHHHDDEKENAMGETTKIDPVCGMTVDPATAAATAEYDGTTYYFCATGCQNAFQSDPSKFV